MLHELREVAARSSDEEVNVIRGKDECHHLDPGEPRRTSEYTADYLVRPFGRTEEQTPVQAADSGEVWNFRLIHSNWSCQAPPHFVRGATKHKSRQRRARHLAEACPSARGAVCALPGTACRPQAWDTGRGSDARRRWKPSDEGVKPASDR